MKNLLLCIKDMTHSFALGSVSYEKIIIKSKRSVLGSSHIDLEVTPISLLNVCWRVQKTINVHEKQKFKYKEEFN